MITDENILTWYDDNKIIEQEQFCYSLASQCTTALSSLCQESFDQALTNSVFNSTNPRPLALYIYDDQSPTTYIFNEFVLYSESINVYLAEQFILWKWNLTKENYHELLTIVATHAGEEVAAIIVSSPTEVYPLLICLIFDQGQIKVECIIQGIMSESEAFGLLIQARDAFGDRFELPDTSGLSLTNISTENWSIPASNLIQVPTASDEFRRVAADFDGGASSIIRIDRIENTIWLMQYLNQKQMVDARLGYNDTERLLFHGCPYAAAEQILQQAFDHSRIGRNGTYYGHGFYFSTSRQVSDRFAVPNPSTREKRILMCRVLVGRSCEGDSTMRTCPSNYDSTTGKSNIYVVYSNRHILPEYLITYK
ncbi:unnamed protein product [Rotaria sordida]|uniref:Poly [ADP-ribose] polymerase n=1 Tax=Rotaria sordida TaxID=392033 RepID=A0A815QKP5_9BILA|nr:unnamed protein product [Rotaria sordida]